MNYRNAVLAALMLTSCQAMATVEDACSDFMIDTASHYGLPDSRNSFEGKSIQFWEYTDIRFIVAYFADSTGNCKVQSFDY